jgi:hypothetical protein
MKKIINKFKKLIRFVVSIFASREFAFIYCLVGTVAQITHTYFLTSHISSFSGNFKIFQATLISFFISSSLLYFVAIADDVRNEIGKRIKESKRVFLAINIFMFIEIVINFYYYSRHLIIDSAEVQVFDFIFSILVACLLPVTIKLYANSIRAKEWIKDFDDSKESTISNNHEFVELFNKKFDEFILTIDVGKLVSKESILPLIDDIKESIDGDISQIFAKNQELFLKQFENKCQAYIQKNIQSISQ